MADAKNSSELEGARARLEQALSRLTQEVAASKKAVDDARSGQIEATAVKGSLEDRLHAVEQENLRLHEQIATLSLSQASSDNSNRVETLEAEKHSIQQNYHLLKRQYTSLQDELENLQNTSTAPSGSDDELRAALLEAKSQLAAMTDERDRVRRELDHVIAELEGYLSNSVKAAGE